MAVTNKLTNLPYPPALKGREWAEVAGEVQEYLFKVAAMAERVQSQVVKLADPQATSVRPIFSQYAAVQMTTPQTVNLTTGSHIQFHTITQVGGFPAGNVSLSTGSGQANGNITLSGYRYLCLFHVYGTTNEGNLTGGWFRTDGTNLYQEQGILYTGWRIQDPVALDITNESVSWNVFDARSSPITMNARIGTSVNPVEITAAVASFYPLS